MSQSTKAVLASLCLLILTALLFHRRHVIKPPSKSFLFTLGLLMLVALPLFVQNEDKIRPYSRKLAVTNNLRQFSSTAEYYIQDRHVNQATYTDLVGTGPDKYIRSIQSVAGEDYSSLVVTKTTTQLSISSAAFGTVTFNL